MRRSANPRTASAAGKRTAEDKSAARWFDWQGAPGSPTSRPRTADVSSSGGSGKAAARAAAEAQANAARNGRANNGVTSPDKTGLHPAIRSNDQTDYKRRHGLDLRTTKVNHQWSHSGHFPGMPLPCWGQGCSKLWGCGHGVGDEELDRQLDLPEWEGRGNDPSVPEWLRYEGKIVNRKLSKRFVLGFCRHVWDYKYPPPLIIEIKGVPTEVKREPRHGGLSLAFHECMKTTYGPPRLVAGVAYNMYYGLLRFRKEHADLDIFCRILTDELPSAALFAYMEEVEKLRELLRNADVDRKERLSRTQVIEVLKKRFGAAFNDAAARDAREAMDAEQPPLSVHPSWYLDPQNSKKAAKINDVEYEKLISRDRHADQGPFAQIAKTLIIEELRKREWPSSSGDVRRRKYDFNAWRKARAGAAAASVVGYLSQAISSAYPVGVAPGVADRAAAPLEEGPGLRDRATREDPGTLSSASLAGELPGVFSREPGTLEEGPGLSGRANIGDLKLVNRAMETQQAHPGLVTGASMKQIEERDWSTRGVETTESISEPEVLKRVVDPVKDTGLANRANDRGPVQNAAVTGQSPGRTARAPEQPVKEADPVTRPLGSSGEDAKPFTDAASKAGSSLYRAKEASSEGVKERPVSDMSTTSGRGVAIGTQNVELPRLGREPTSDTKDVAGLDKPLGPQKTASRPL